MFRKRNSGSGDGAEVEQLLQQDTPLDESEQERIVQEFEEMQLQNSRLWRRMFGAGKVSQLASRPACTPVHTHTRWRATT